MIGKVKMKKDYIALSSDISFFSFFYFSFFFSFFEGLLGLGFFLQNTCLDDHML